MQTLVGILLISAVILFIAYDVKKRRKKKITIQADPHYAKKEAEREKERAEKMSEYQKGSGRGGPFH